MTVEHETHLGNVSRPKRLNPYSTDFNQFELHPTMNEHMEASSMVELARWFDSCTRYGLKATEVWVELRLVCEAAHKRGDDDLLRRIYDFARWCWESPEPHLHRAVEFAFYQHVPVVPAMRRDIHRRFTLSEFQQLREPFSSQLSAEEMAQLEREFSETSHPAETPKWGWLRKVIHKVSRRAR